MGAFFIQANTDQRDRVLSLLFDDTTTRLYHQTKDIIINKKKIQTENRLIINGKDITGSKPEGLEILMHFQEMLQRS